MTLLAENSFLPIGFKCFTSTFSHITKLQLNKLYIKYTNWISIHFWVFSVKVKATDYFFHLLIFCSLFYFSDGQVTEKLCPDGMVFNDYSPDQEKCDLPYNIDCSKRPKLRKCALISMHWMCKVRWKCIQITHTWIQDSTNINGCWKQYIR